MNSQGTWPGLFILSHLGGYVGSTSAPINEEWSPIVTYRAVEETLHALVHARIVHPAVLRLMDLNGVALSGSVMLYIIQVKEELHDICFLNSFSIHTHQYVTNYNRLSYLILVMVTLLCGCQLTWMCTAKTRCLSRE